MVLSDFVAYTKYHHIIYTMIIIGGVGTLYSFYHLDWFMRIGLTIGGILSLLYSLPVLSDHRRLRDFHYVKIFLIAFVWTFLTCTLPALDVSIDGTLIWIFSIERILFFLAITIPFDIRDYHIDQSQSVGTIPSLIGEERAKILAQAIIVIAAIVISISYYLDYIEWDCYFIFIYNLCDKWLGHLQC